MVGRVNDLDCKNGILVGLEVSRRLIDFSEKLQNIEIFAFDTLDSKLKERKTGRRDLLSKGLEYIVLPSGGCRHEEFTKTKLIY